MPEATGFDIIGDVHGHAGALHELLHHLGYFHSGNVWSHPAARRVIFTGDFIHGGDQTLAVLITIRAMIEGGSALAVLGNHEAALLHHYNTGDDELPLRSLSGRQWELHQESLGRFCAGHPHKWREWLDWLQTLPLWLDLGSIRVVHACWHEPSMLHFPDNSLRGPALHSTAANGLSRTALEILLKGPTVAALEGRDERPVRLNWWQPSRGQICLPEVLLNDLAVGSFSSLLQPEDHSYEYSSEAPVLFIGHYNHRGDCASAILAPNVVCVDHGIKDGGSLVAYRWDSGASVCADAFRQLS